MINNRKKIIMDVLAIFLIVGAYLWKGIPLLASIIVGWLIIRNFSGRKNEDSENEEE